MLSLLHIENIAVIECAEISFDRGFNVLTGETGAGKSIVIDAISAILGERAYRDMIRTGTQAASVRAVFTGVPELKWFEENGVEYDSETVIQRQIYLDGKNVCRVNGSLVSVSILRKLGIQLINIHGQHDTASLFDEDNHLTMLDAFADNQQLQADYQEKYASVAALRREIERAGCPQHYHNPHLRPCRGQPQHGGVRPAGGYGGNGAQRPAKRLPVCGRRKGTASEFRRCGHCEKIQSGDKAGAVE